MTVVPALHGFAIVWDCSVDFVTVVHVLPPSVEYCNCAAVWADPSGALCRHWKVTLPPVVNTAELDGEMSVGGSGGHSVTMMPDSSQSETPVEL